MSKWKVINDLQNYKHDALFIDEQREEGTVGALVVPITPRAYELLTDLSQKFGLGSFRGLIFVPMDDYSLLFSCFDEKGYNLSTPPF